MPGDPGLRTPVLLTYVLPGFVVALPTIPIYIVLPMLYGVELGVGLAATGFILLGARLFDTVSDPLVGAASDRFVFRGNRRKPWIAIGAVIAGLGLYMVLNPPSGVSGAYLLWWSVVLYAGWTMVAVPYMAWGAELSNDYDERTRITAWREGVGLLGLVGAGAVAAAAAGIGWSERESIGALAWAAIALGAIAFPLLLRRVPETPANTGPRLPATQRALKSVLLDLARNRPFLRLLAAWFLNGLANGIPAALFFIYLEHGLGAGEKLRPLFVLVYFASAVAAIALWKRVSKRLGKHRSWCWAMGISCAVFLTVPWIPEGAYTAFATVCVITGATLGADLALPPAMQADVVDYGSLRTGKPRAGLLFALWGMSTKLALAVAVGLALPGVEAAGFDPATSSEEGKQALSVIYSLFPAVIKLTAISMVWGFPLTAEKQAVIRRALDCRDAQLKSTKEAAW